MSAGCGVGGPERLRTGQPGPGLGQPPTVDGPAPPAGSRVSSQRSLCRLWNSLCPPGRERKKHGQKRKVSGAASLVRHLTGPCFGAAWSIVGTGRVKYRITGGTPIPSSRGPRRTGGVHSLTKFRTWAEPRAEVTNEQINHVQRHRGRGAA